VALNLLVVLGLLHHDDLVDAPLAGGGDGANVKGDVTSGLGSGGTSSGGGLLLPGIPGGDGGLLSSSSGRGNRGSGMVMTMLMSVIVAMSGVSLAVIEGEGVQQGAGLSLLPKGGRGGQQDQEAKLANHD
jgi:hypothetical protein